MSLQTALLIYALAQIADVVTTLWGLRRGAVEANPLMARLMGTFGKRWFVAKLLLNGFLAYLMAASGAIAGLLLVSAVVAVVAVHNARIARAQD